MEAAIVSGFIAASLLLVILRAEEATDQTVPIMCLAVFGALGCLTMLGHKEALDRTRYAAGPGVELVQAGVDRLGVTVAPEDEVPQDMFRAAARASGISERLLRAIVEVESAGNPEAVSSSGALGLMQVMPTRAGREVNLANGIERDPTMGELFDPHRNVRTGTQYLEILNARYWGHIPNATTRGTLVVASYHTGPTRVRAIYDGADGDLGETWKRLPEATREYLRRVQRQAPSVADWQMPNPQAT